MIVNKLKDVAAVMKYMKGRKSFDRVLEKVTILSAGDGKCSAELQIEDDHVNSMGNLHNGLSTTIVDCISGYALMTKISGVHVSIDIHMRYISQVMKGDYIVIDGSVSKFEPTLAFLTVQIRNKASGDLVIQGSQTRYIP